MFPLQICPTDLKFQTTTMEHDLASRSFVLSLECKYYVIWPLLDGKHTEGGQPAVFQNSEISCKAWKSSPYVKCNVQNTKLKSIGLEFPANPQSLLLHRFILCCDPCVTLIPNVGLIPNDTGWVMTRLCRCSSCMVWRLSVTTKCPRKNQELSKLSQAVNVTDI